MGIKRLCIAWLAMSAVACSDGDSGGAPVGKVDPQRPADEQSASDIAALYQRSCIACHSTGAAGAPRTGDVAAWQALLDTKGIDGLIESAVNGIGSMPPTGFCSQCSTDDYKALILFMSEG